MRAGADEKARDKRGRPAQYYLDHPDDLALPTKAEPTGRNRQRQRRTPPKDHARGRKPRENGTTPGGGKFTFPCFSSRGLFIFHNLEVVRKRYRLNSTRCRQLGVCKIAVTTPYECVNFSLYDHHNLSFIIRLLPFLGSLVSSCWQSATCCCVQRN